MMLTSTNHCYTCIIPHCNQKKTKKEGKGCEALPLFVAYSNVLMNASGKPTVFSFSTAFFAPS